MFIAINGPTRAIERPSRVLRRLAVFCLVVVATIGLAGGNAAAHNSLDGSTPADGAVLAAPREITWTFANAVPLDTLTVTLIDATGNRADLDGSRHGAGGRSEVVTPLPTLSPGAVSVRWRLVGPDGHPVTGRIGFTISADPSAAPTTTPAITAAQPTPSSAVAADEPSRSDQADDTWRTPPTFRWLLRVLSYVAILAAAGIVLTQSLVMHARSRLNLLAYLTPALTAVAIGAAAQILVLASDVSGQPLWRAVSDVGLAIDTDAGMALFVRIVLSIVGWLLLLHAPPCTAEVRSNVLLLLAVGLLMTWSFAGHARSMRWPTVGVVVDVLHHGAAAAWLGGLAIVGAVVLPKLAPQHVPPTMRRFSRLATVAVTLIVVTGLVQAVRLVGGVSAALRAQHGQLLAAKVVVLMLMLAAAEANRRRVSSRLGEEASRADVQALRRGLCLELIIGLGIIGLTAALVVSPPPVSAAAVR